MTPMTLISDEISVCKLARGEFASVIRVLKIRFHIYEQ